MSVQSNLCVRWKNFPNAQQFPIPPQHSSIILPFHSYQGALAAHMSGSGGSDEAAQKWLQEQKLKLVAQKKTERDAETAQYKAQQKVR